MKTLKITLAAMIALGLMVSFAFAAGNVEKGKALFNNTKLGKTGMACNTCHSGGKMLAAAATDKNLPATINRMITTKLKGKAIKGAELANLEAYVKSIAGGQKTGAAAPAPKKRRAIEGC